MRVCPACGHTNLPSFPTCSKCNSSLAGVPETSGNDEVAKLMQSRAAAERRKKAIFGAITLGLMALVGGKMMQDRAAKAKAQEKLDWADRWGSLDKSETGAFWACVVAGDVNVDMFSTGQQIQQRIEGAYATQTKTYASHLLDDCVPKIERARQAFGTDAPAEFAEPMKKYLASLPRLQSGIEDYAERIKNRGATKDLDQLIQEYGDAWQSNTKPTPETIAFDKFMRCAIPELDKLKNAQALLEHLADTCYKRDAVAFMERARSQCGKFLQEPDPKGTPAPSYQATMKRLYEEEGRQLRAWEDCGRRARKGKKSNDLETFLVAAGEYMEARSEVVKAARGVAESVH